MVRVRVGHGCTIKSYQALHLSGFFLSLFLPTISMILEVAFSSQDIEAARGLQWSSNESESMETQKHVQHRTYKSLK
jgi:hypothetical protein